MPRWSHWLIFLPVAILSLFSPKAFAEPVQGLNTLYYAIDEVPPVQSDNEYELCGSELENNINRSYDGESFEDCTGDLFMVHMTGFITIPEHETIEFFLASDDGGEITIGNNTWGSWTDQGCSATMSGEIDISAGSADLNLWMYENGGASCLMLAWKIDNNDWEIVPDSAFTTTATVSTTTTEMTTTTLGVTTTIESTTTQTPTTSSLVPSSTSIPQVQTTQSPQTTEETSTSTSSYLTTSTSSTTPVVIPQEEPEMVYPVPTGTTTTVVQIEEIETTFEEPPLEEFEPIIIEGTIAPIIINEDDFVVITDEPISPSDTLGEPVSDPIVELLPVGDPITDEVLDSIIENAFTPDASPEEVFDALTEILGSDLTEEQFITVMETVFSEEASVEQMSAAVENLLSSDLSAEELATVFESAFDSDLSDAETIALAEEILSSPLDNEEFGIVINAIFDEKVSDEILVETFSAILTPEISESKFAQVVNVLENANITSDQVAQVVDLVIAQDSGISEGQATELATSAKVLESVDGEQAEEVFGAVEASNLTPDEGLAIVAALENAETAVVKAFEKKLDVFQGSFDIYKPIGSSIPIRERRILNIVTATLFVMSAPIPVTRVSVK